MDNSSNLSLPHDKCMKCKEGSYILLSSLIYSGGVIGICDHKFCQSCFRKENTSITNIANHTFICPYCIAPVYEYIQSIDDAILIGEAATVSLATVESLLCIPQFSRFPQVLKVSV